MSCQYGCHCDDHVSRRSFLGGITGGALGMLGFSNMVRAESTEKLATQQKRVVVFYLAGGASQLETWDPKPGTDTGGPFQAIETSVPGVHISELLPHTAKQMHHLALVRGVNTRENNHGKGSYIMQTGRRQTPGFEYPYLGSALSSLLVKPGNPLPGYISLNGGGSRSEAAFLGPRFAPVTISGDKGPKNLALPKNMTTERDQRRRKLRSRVSKRFALGRRQADTEIYNASYDQAAALLARRDIFDLSNIPAKEKERYGTGPIASHCLMALRLVENGVPFVRVRHRDYDSHSENFNFHIEQLGEFDRPFATFISDLDERGLLEHTLVICMAEFGRTPKINPRMGRDHWGTAWSVALAGCGIKGGAVVGKTNANGTKVIEREVDGGPLFHTYYQAVGLDPHEDFDNNGQPVSRANPKNSAIQEILA